MLGDCDCFPACCESPPTRNIKLGHLAATSCLSLAMICSCSIGSFLFSCSLLTWYLASALRKRSFERESLSRPVATFRLRWILATSPCYKSSNPSLIDALLTTHKRRIANVLNINTGISDFHNLIACSTKMHVPRNTNRLIHYRSYKHFDETSFKHDLEIAPFHVGDMFDEVDDTFWFNHTLIQDIVDGHAPIKRKKTVKYPVPFMKLHKACLNKAMLRNKYFKYGRTKYLWDRYRKIRNQVTKLKATSMNSYILFLGCLIEIGVWGWHFRYIFHYNVDMFRIDQGL